MSFMLFLLASARTAARFDSSRLNRNNNSTNKNNRFVPTHISLSRYGTTYGPQDSLDALQQTAKSQREKTRARERERDRQTDRPTTKQLSWGNQLLKASKAIRQTQQEPSPAWTNSTRPIFYIFFFFKYLQKRKKVKTTWAQQKSKVPQQKHSRHIRNVNVVDDADEDDGETSNGASSTYLFAYSGSQECVFSSCIRRCRFKNI